jgi:AraC family transcriptional regulator, transcriptional activator of pobA
MWLKPQKLKYGKFNKFNFFSGYLIFSYISRRFFGWPFLWQCLIVNTLKTRKNIIPYYKDINTLLAELPVPHRTMNPDFFCLRLRGIEQNIYMPPFKRGFYFVALLTNADKTKIEVSENKVTNKKSMLVFQPPGLVYSFHRHSETTGYILYFKQECFSFFKPAIETEFPFFENLHTDVLEISQEELSKLSPHFEDVFVDYENSNDPTHKVASLKLLALLYKLKDIAAFSQYQLRPITPHHAMLKKFVRLVNNHYIQKRTVEEYAHLLSVTANYLSQSIKLTSGKNALTHINERLLAEAKSLISFTGLDVTEIAYRLNFTDPTNFGKFFKKHTGITPLDFRNKSTK